MPTKRFLVDIDLGKNELQNAVIQNLGTAPGTPVEGQLYYDTVDDTVYMRNASTWVDINSGGASSHVGVTLTASVPTTDALTLSGTDNQTITANYAVAATSAGVISGADKTKIDALSGTNSGDQDLSYNAGTHTVELSSGNNAIIPLAVDDGATEGLASFTATDFDVTAGNVAIDYTNGQAAATGAKGFLTSTDWNTFNNKVSNVSTTLELGTASETVVNITSDGATDDVALTAASASSAGIMTKAMYDAQVLNNAKNTNVVTNLSLGAIDGTTMVVASSDGTDATLLAANTTEAGLLTATLWNKLDLIEASADVTDATNVESAGAVMESDTTVASMSFYIDDDTMATASDTKFATSESIKAYADGLLAANDAMVFKGGLDASGVNELPAGEAGDTYKITVAGDFNSTTDTLEIGDMVICDTDSTAANTPANWVYLENNQEAASTTVAGYVRLATGAETNTGTSATIAVTPDGLDDWTGSAQITTVGTIASGTWSGDVIVEAKLENQSGTNTGDEVSATESVEGVVEMATTTESATGTDTDRAVTAAGLTSFYAAQGYAADIGNGALTTIPVTHGLSSRDLSVQLYDNATYDEVECRIVRTDVDTVNLLFNTAPTTDEFRVIITKVA